jgi:hypothetical protein
MLGCLPVAGGLLDQPDDLIEGMKLWRFMRHVKDLMNKEDNDAIYKSAALVHMMNIIDVGEEEANAMIENVKRDSAE